MKCQLKNVASHIDDLNLLSDNRAKLNQLQPKNKRFSAGSLKAHSLMIILCHLFPLSRH